MKLRLDNGQEIEGTPAEMQEFLAGQRNTQDLFVTLNQPVKREPAVKREVSKAVKNRRKIKHVNYVPEKMWNKALRLYKRGYSRSAALVEAGISGGSSFLRFNKRIKEAGLIPVRRKTRVKPKRTSPHMTWMHRRAKQLRIVNPALSYRQAWSIAAKHRRMGGVNND